jgi:hypothetical protein
MALVDQARQPARTGKDREQGDLGQGDRRRSIVDEQDLVARERELVPPAGGGTVHRRENDLTPTRRHLLHAVARLVGELAEADLVRVRRRRQHLDVRTGAEHLVERSGDDDSLHTGVLEPQTLQHIVQLDVDREVVRVQLQLVVVAQPAGGIDRHRERRHGTVDVEPPVAVPRRVGLEADPVRSHDQMLQSIDVPSQDCRMFR